MPDRPDSLEAIETSIWQQLTQCISDKAHPWRTPVLATVNRESADARIVVLREVDARRRRLMVYTDERAGKVAQLLNHPRGTFVMWSPTLSWQLRCHVRLTIEMSGLAVSSRWARVKLTPGAREYLAPLPTGTPLNEAADKDSGAIAPDHHHFSVIDAEIEVMDWLELHPNGHRRAIFDALGPRWIQP